MQISISINDPKVQKFLNEFQNETPRAAAILGWAYLDDLLNELLKSRLIEDKRFFKNDINRLNSERRINLCYLTGVINKQERDDLQRIKKIRGQFAHKISLKSFTRNDISTECDKLKIIKFIQDKDSFINKPRDKYTFSVAFYITVLKDKLKHCRRIETF